MNRGGEQERSEQHRALFDAFKQNIVVDVDCNLVLVDLNPILRSIFASNAKPHTITCSAKAIKSTKLKPQKQLQEQDTPQRVSATSQEHITRFSY